jgi:hypothetical protein
MGECAIHRSMYDVPCPSLWGLNCVNYTTDMSVPSHDKNVHAYYCLFWTVRFDKGMVLILVLSTITI